MGESIVNRGTTSDAVAFAKAVSDAGGANKRVVIDKVTAASVDQSSGKLIEASVTWHTEDRGSRFVSWIKDLTTGYTGKVTVAVDALIKGGRDVNQGGSERKAVFESIRNLTDDLKGSRGNVARAFHRNLPNVSAVVPANDLLSVNDDSRISLAVPSGVTGQPEVSSATNKLPPKPGSVTVHSVYDPETQQHREPTEVEQNTFKNAVDINTRRFPTPGFAEALKRFGTEPSSAEFSKDSWATPNYKLQPENFRPVYDNFDVQIPHLVAQLNAKQSGEGYQVGGAFNGREDALVVVTPHYLEHLSVPGADVEIDTDDPFNQVLSDVGLDRETAEQKWFADPYELLLKSRLQQAQQAQQVGGVTRAEALTIASQVAEEVIRAEAGKIKPDFSAEVFESDGKVRQGLIDLAKVPFEAYARERGVNAESVNWVVGHYSDDPYLEGFLKNRLASGPADDSQDPVVWLKDMFVERFEGAIKTKSIPLNVFEPSSSGFRALSD